MIGIRLLYNVYEDKCEYLASNEKAKGERMSPNTRDDYSTVKYLSLSPCGLIISFKEQCGFFNTKQL